MLISASMPPSLACQRELLSRGALLRRKHPQQNKNETATAPSRFFKKKEKNRTSCRRLHRMETTPLQVDAVPWESAGRSGILPLLPIGKACQRLKRSLLSMPKYYTIFVEIARCGFIQPAINVTLHFVEIAQLSTQRPYKKPRRVQNTPGQKTCGL